MRWIGVAGGYEVAVRGEGAEKPVVVCRRAGGKELAKVPAKVKQDPGVASLMELCERLAERGRAVREQVEAWMLRSLPVPVEVLHAVWEDPAWRHALTGLIVAPVHGGTPDLECAGVLLGLDGAKGVRLAPVDGDVLWSGADTFAIPHPILLGDDLVDRLRRGAALDHDQAVEQLHRERWSRPNGMDRTIDVIDAFWFTEARYESGAAFERRVIGSGGRVRGDVARFTVHDPEPIGIELEVKYSGPMSPAYLGTLTFANGGREIGDIAWSEATRILMSLFAGRTVEDEEGEVLGVADVYADYCDRLRGEPGTAPDTRHRPPSREVLLRAGAALPGAPASADEDVLVAARFTHPALNEPVVSLVRRAAVPAERASMALPGLVAAGDGDVGAVRAGPLGFLAMALHSYPAQHVRIVALHQVLHAARKTATGKPGLARKALNEPAGGLATDSPGLLPLYFDECARIMAAAGSTAYAAAYFEKARAAESEHSLPVDEARLVDAYVTAGSGAVGPKSLKHHAARLAERHSPDEACRRQRRLLTEWCEAGEGDALILAAGWAGAARAAGWKPGERPAAEDRAADERAVRALLDHGCLRTAPAAIWKFVRPLLFRMAGQDAAVRRSLAGLLPEPAEDTPEAKAAAVSVLVANLDGAGARAPFTSDVEMSGARVRQWVGRFMSLYAGLALPVSGLDDLLRDAGKRLTAEGLTCGDHIALLGPDDNYMYFYDGKVQEEHTDYDFPLLELALGLGVPLAPPRYLHTFKLHSWLDTAERPDLAATAADPAWGPLLRDAVIGNLSAPLGLGPPAHELQTRPSVVKALVNAPGTREIVENILAEHAKRVPGHGLPDVHAALCDVERFTVAGVPGGSAEAVRAILAEADPVRALATTLRGGVLGELDLEVLSRYETNTVHNYMEESGADLLVIEAGRLWRHAFRASAVTPGGVGPGHGFGTYDDRESVHKKAEARELYDRCLIVVDGRVTVVDHNGPHCPHGGTHPNAPSVRPVDGEPVRFPYAESDATVWRGEGRLIELRDSTGRTIGRYLRGSGWVPEHNGADGFRIHFHRFAAKSGWVPPPGWWSAMTPRDPEGSRTLRGVDDATARRLLGLADTSFTPRMMELMAPGSDLIERYNRFNELKARLRALLPEINDEMLRTCVTSIVWTAIECRERAFALARRLDLAPPPHLEPVPVTPSATAAEVPGPRPEASEREPVQARSPRAAASERIVRLAEEAVPKRGYVIVGRNGPPPLDRDAVVTAFAEATGLSIAQAIVLLSPSARSTAWPDGWAPGRVASPDPDDAELVRAHNLTQTGLRAAALTLQAMTDAGEAIDLVEALMPEDPADLWRSGPDLERAVTLWSGRHPRLTQLTADLWITLTAGLDERDLPLARSLVALLGERLDERPALVPGRFGQAAKLLEDRLPAHHPARAVAAERLADLGAAYTAPETHVVMATGVTSVNALEGAIGELAVHLPDHGRLAIGDLLTATLDGDGYRIRLRPSRLTGPEDPMLERLESALKRNAATNALSDLRFLISIV
ncbi:DUF4132 domain-containing protein [Spirillospora sp. CA-128828]|uniref:DUF4132 domain-containing protein n=1 Tax=Spirillospora sp. CA-128828 TaxID=3240033 RepID=UPI003D91F433